MFAVCSLIQRRRERVAGDSGFARRRLARRNALAAINRTEEHLQRMERTQEVLGNPRSSFEAYVLADTAFHTTLAEASMNPVFVIVLEPIQNLLTASRRRNLRDGAIPAYEQHGKVLQAVRAGNAAAAARAMDEHLKPHDDQRIALRLDD